VQIEGGEVGNISSLPFTYMSDQRTLRCETNRIGESTMDGYMIDVQYDEATLRVHAKNAAARFALTGAKAESVMGDDGKAHVQTTRGAQDVEIPRANITGATFKRASMLVNGNLAVTTVDGARYQMHFRKKSNADFVALARELGAF
jgi:hypothetical protein